MDKPIIILGSGGHAKVVADTLKLLGNEKYRKIAEKIYLNRY